MVKVFAATSSVDSAATSSYNNWTPIGKEASYLIQLIQIFDSFFHRGYFKKSLSPSILSFQPGQEQPNHYQNNVEEREAAYYAGNNHLSNPYEALSVPNAPHIPPIKPPIHPPFPIKAEPNYNTENYQDYDLCADLNICNGT